MAHWMDHAMWRVDVFVDDCQLLCASCPLNVHYSSHLQIFIHLTAILSLKCNCTPFTFAHPNVFERRDRPVDGGPPPFVVLVSSA